MPRKKKISSYEEYLKQCPDQKDMVVFDDEVAAYNFGKKLRDNIAKEQGVESWLDCEGIEVDISGCIVRMKIVDLVAA